MELQQFVAETLRQIIDGVVSAQGYTRQSGAEITATGSYSPAASSQKDQVYCEVDGNWQFATDVAFDVAVTASETTTKEGGGKVGISVLSVGVTGQRATESSSISRVQFTVPVFLPPQSKGGK